MQRTLLPLLGFGILAVACQQPTPIEKAAPEFSAASVKAVLDSMNKTYDGRFRDSTTAYFAARYTNDACVFAPNMARVCGIDAITKFYWWNGDSQTTTLNITCEEVSGTATEVTEVGNYRVIDDEGTQLDAGKFMALYRNDGGTWKVHREIWNSDIPLPEPGAPAEASAQP